MFKDTNAVKNIAVIGAGPAGLMAAEVLSQYD
ncbi:MAG TPA: FAD-dependent monooxygenase, partial [Acinetobacter sp.]|nr:FAD-dependent monooxygenase [Acinetobacter sp.]